MKVFSFLSYAAAVAVFAISSISVIAKENNHQIDNHDPSSERELFFPFYIGDKHKGPRKLDGDATIERIGDKNKRGPPRKLDGDATIERIGDKNKRGPPRKLDVEDSDSNRNLSDEPGIGEPVRGPGPQLRGGDDRLLFATRGKGHGKGDRNLNIGEDSSSHRGLWWFERWFSVEDPEIDDEEPEQMNDDEDRLLFATRGKGHGKGDRNLNTEEDPSSNHDEDRLLFATRGKGHGKGDRNLQVDGQQKCDLKMKQAVSTLMWQQEMLVEFVKYFHEGLSPASTSSSFGLHTVCSNFCFEDMCARSGYNCGSRWSKLSPNLTQGKDCYTDFCLRIFG